MDIIQIILHFKIGNIQVPSSIITTWIIMLVIGVICLILNNKIFIKSKKHHQNNFQLIAEGMIVAMENAVAEVLPNHVPLVFPFISSLWIFILFANLIGIIPGFSSPTADLSVTSALAILVFLSVHWFGIRADGIKKYLQHYLTPSPFFLPFHILGEFTRTLALAVRLFGNMMSLELTVIIMLMIAGFLIPIPILMLHIIEACIQTYIFGMLALFYIAGGIHSQENMRIKLSTTEK